MDTKAARARASQAVPAKRACSRWTRSPALRPFRERHLPQSRKYKKSCPMLRRPSLATLGIVRL